MINLIHLEKEVEAGKKELKEFVEQFPLVKGEDGKEYREIPAAQEAKLGELVGDVDAKQKRFNVFTSVDAYTSDAQEKIGNRPGGTVGLVHEDMLNDAYRESIKNGAKWTQNVKSIFDRKGVNGLTREVKDVIAAANNPLRAAMESDVVTAASRPVQLLDFFPMYPTEQDSIVYRRQTTRTNAAAAKLEGQALAQSSFVTEIVTEPIRVIGHYMDITEQEYADAPTVRALMDMELPMMVMQEFDRQLAVGDGGATELDGLEGLTGAGTVAAGATNKIKVLREAVKDVRFTGRANPNLWIMHPDDWEKVINLQDAGGQFLIDILQDEITPRFGGRRVVECDAITAGKPKVLDTTYFPIAMRQGLVVEFTNTDGEKFQNLTRTARAYVRAGFKHRRAAALCEVTGF